jgi:hypothetical protein
MQKLAQQLKERGTCELIGEHAIPFALSQLFHRS